MARRLLVFMWLSLPLFLASPECQEAWFLRTKPGKVNTWDCGCGPKKSQFKGQTTAGRALDFHEADPDPILSTPYEIPSQSGVSPEFRVRSKLWVPLDVAPKQKKANSLTRVMSLFGGQTNNTRITTLALLALNTGATSNTSYCPLSPARDYIWDRARKSPREILMWSKI